MSVGGAAVVGAPVVGAAIVGAGVVGAAVVAGAMVIEIDGSGVRETVGDGDDSADEPAGRVSRIKRPKAINAITAAPRNAASWTLDPVALGLPAKLQGARRGHVAEQRRRRDDGGAREVPLAADAHAVLPVTVE